MENQVSNNTWEFSFRKMDAMNKCNPNYNVESGVALDFCDWETFESKSSDLVESCIEFDEFARDIEMYDVDPEASFSNGERYQIIEKLVEFYK